MASNIQVGKKLPEIQVKSDGLLVPDYEIKDNKMVFKKDGDIHFTEWNSTSCSGRVKCIYHLAARNGIDEINKPFIDALIKANLPEKLPDSPYKTITILNLDDALWGTSSIAKSRFKKSQKKFSFAYYVADEDGVAQKEWGLKKNNSAVIILDQNDKVLFFKEGKLTPKEINKAVTLIKDSLKNNSNS